MVDTLTVKIKAVKAKGAKYRAPCLCGCKSTSPSTIAAHGKTIMKEAKMKSLSAARSAASSSSRRSVPKKHRKSTHSTGFTENNTPEDPMEVDHPQGGGPGKPSTPLDRVWANRASRREREDEDLVSDPGSPELSEDDDETGSNGNLDPDEPELLTDDEGPPAHVQILATDQLSADFQLRAAKAGTLSIWSLSIDPTSLIFIFCAQCRTIWTQMTSIPSALSTITSQNPQRGMPLRVCDMPSPIKCKTSNRCTKHNGGLLSSLA